MGVNDDKLFMEPSGDKVRFRILKENPGFKRFEDKRPLKKRIGSVVQFTSEVVVKVSGYTRSGEKATGRGVGPVSSHINYIARHGKVQVETEKGELILGKESIKEFCDAWQASIDATRISGKSRDVMHLVLSMPGRQDVEKMRDAIRDFAAGTFGYNHEYAFVLHEDTENIHGHLAVKCRGFDGKQMQMAPGVAQEWRIAFASSLRARGIDAEATPRSYRGVLRKSEKQIFRHMERPSADSGRKPRIPSVRRKQFNEILDEIKEFGNGKPFSLNEFEEKAKCGLKNLREKWLEISKNFDERKISASENYQEVDGKDLSRKIRNFVENMPEIKTKRESIREKMIEVGNEALRAKGEIYVDVIKEYER